MFGWFKKKRKQEPVLNAEAQLLQEIRKALPGADEEKAQIVAACAGLLASIAYADRNYSTAEEQRIADLLQTMEGIGGQGASAILSTLRSHALQFSTIHAPRFSRILLQLGDRDLRCHVLELLVEVAAADHEISNKEIMVLRHLTSALGLEQADYNAAQEKHKGKLAALRS